jgi:hypothetical protein
MSKIEMSYTEKDGVLLPNLQISNNSEEDNQPLGKYSRMAMEYLHENHPQRFMILKMDGTLMEKMHLVHREVLETEPMPATEDIMEKTRHMNSLRLAAEEIVLNEIVFKVR